MNLDRAIRFSGQAKKRKKALVRTHYQRVTKKVRFFYEHYKSSCTYEITETVDISRMLCAYMKRKGFQCTVLGPNVIYVWWKPKQVESGIRRKLEQLSQDTIERAAKNGATQCVVTVPTVVFGYPLYDANEEAVALSKRMTKKGFIVDHVSHNTVRVCWDEAQILQLKKAERDKQTLELQRKRVKHETQRINEKRYSQFFNLKKRPFG